jgi:hypothetical protein
MLTYDTIKIGMNVRCIYNCSRTPYAHREGKTAVVLSITYPYVYVQWDDGLKEYGCWSGPEYFEDSKRKPRKAIPDFPLDPSLPVLMAGYIQDRARKRFQ